MLFPTPIPSLVARFGYLSGAQISYAVVGFFTDSHFDSAKRLSESLQAFTLPHLLFEVPSVHRSTSPKGVLDEAYTKPNFIAHALRLFTCSILYVDCDVVFRERPSLIDDLSDQEVDFAILNWLALERNDAYRPLTIEGLSNSNQPQARFFRTSHQIPFSSTTQLICSGAVQFWGRSDQSLDLLRAWHRCIVLNPYARDDHSLDFAFNNLTHSRCMPLRHSWLPKSYCRYAWWIFDKPTIDHPDFPYSGGKWALVEDSEGRPRINQEKLIPRQPLWEFPEDAFIDSHKNFCYRLNHSNPEPIGQVHRTVYL